MNWRLRDPGVERCGEVIAAALGWLRRFSCLPERRWWQPNWQSLARSIRGLTCRIVTELMSSRSLFGSRGWGGASALALGVSLLVVPVAVLAHGPAPSAVSIVDDDASGPKMIRLTGGYARRVDASQYQFLCPAAWGDDVVSPAATIPGGSVVIAGGRGLILVDEKGGVAPHPDPMAVKPATDFAQLGGKLYVLRTSGADSEVLEVTPAQVRLVFTDPGNWTSIAATSTAIGLQRLTDTHLEQVRITADGSVLGRDSAPAPMDPILVIARATPQELYAVVATAAGRELGQIAGDEWKQIELATSSIAGPVEVPSGEAFIAVDTELAKLPETRVILDGMPPVSCLGRLGDTAYACTRDGLSSMSPQGVGQPIFQLSSMSPPDVQAVTLEMQSLCESQWEHFRFDLLALGVTLMEPPAVPADAGPAAVGAGGSSASSAGAGGAPMAAGGRGGSTAPAQAAPVADSGCTVTRGRSSGSWGAYGASLLAALGVVRRRSRERRARSR